MKRIFLVSALAAAPVFAQAPAEVTLARLDCGTGAKPVNVAERFSDTFAYGKDKQLPFTYSCYVIKHGNDYMVWDTGFAPGSAPTAPKVGIVDRLKELNVTPDQVKYMLKKAANELPKTDLVAQGEGILDLAHGMSTPSLETSVQPYQYGTGTGTLEGSRGSVHVADPTGAPLTGEVDIFGN